MVAVPPGLAGQAQAMMNVSGFDSEIDLNASGQIEESFEPVLEAEVLEGSPLGALSDRLYLRGAVLDEYQNGLQRGSSSREMQPIPLRGGRAELLDLPYEPARRLRITFLRDDPPDRLFTTGLTHAVRVVDGSATLAGDPRSGEVIVDRGQVRSYTLDISPMTRVNDSGEPLPPAFREGRVQEKAVELLDSMGIERDPEARHTDEDERIVRFFERYLRTNFEYTTNPPPVAAGSDPVASFLLEERIGHCERFATGLAALSRAVGIEARVVTGYLTTERLSERVFIAREAHAHAWVEAHVEPGLWLLFDASPPGGVAEAHRVPTGPLAAARRGWQWINDLWVRNVVSYDRSSQSSLLGERYDLAITTASRKSPSFDAVGGLRGVLRSLAIGVGVFALALLVGRAWPALLSWLRRGRGRRAEHGLARHVRRADRVLERAGMPRLTSVPLRAHAAQLRDLGVAMAEPYDELAQLHYRARFAGASGDAGEVSAQADAALERLRREARENGS
jgi:transglutaminase-like putative cysteine protease